MSDQTRTPPTICRNVDEVPDGCTCTWGWTAADAWTLDEVDATCPNHSPSKPEPTTGNPWDFPPSYDS